MAETLSRGDSMTKRYKLGKYPKACKDCKYLGDAMVYMDGTAAYSCCNPKANFLYFSKGVSCRDKIYQYGGFVSV